MEEFTQKRAFLKQWQLIAVRLEYCWEGKSLFLNPSTIKAIRTVSNCTRPNSTTMLLWRLLKMWLNLASLSTKTSLTTMNLSRPSIRKSWSWINGRISTIHPRRCQWKRLERCSEKLVWLAPQHLIVWAGTSKVKVISYVQIGTSLSLIRRQITNIQLSA